MLKKVRTANTVEAEITHRKLLSREIFRFKRPTEAGYSIGSLSFSRSSKWCERNAHLEAKRASSIQA
ncbi:MULTISPECIES: hypothetical protein [unclassified Microcoleus]|uniref:hypothetical protein n=1 Tax=unclassified Microcoleus TaxID=2642155 RepID=UPI0025FE7801|nr:MULTISPECIES: hypothetical protein [unclassified Microcoleus]